MAKERRKRPDRLVKNKRTTNGKEYIGDRWESDKRKAREDGKEIVEYVNGIGVEKGLEPAKKTDTDSNKKLSEKLLDVKKVEEAKKRELVKIRKEIQQGKSNLNEKKLELTRKECEDMGIFIKSDIAFGKYAKLSDETKAMFDKELSGALLEKALLLMNTCFDAEKIAKASLKDSAIAMSILLDKMKMLDGKPEKTVEIKHTLTSLINKNSEKKMTDLDFSDVIDVDAKAIDDDEVSDSE